MNEWMNETEHRVRMGMAGEVEVEQEGETAHCDTWFHWFYITTTR